MSDDPTPSSTDRAGQPIVTTVRVRWGECDPAGVVFYPRFFEWMNVAAHQLVLELGIDTRDVTSPSWSGLPLVGARADFLSPAYEHDELEVRAWVSRIGEKSLTIRYEIVRPSDGQTIARGSDDRVYVGRDEQGRMRSRPLTDRQRAVLAKHASL